MGYRKSERLVIVGGSHGAVAAIETLRRGGYRGRMTLVSEEKVPLFSPTALPYLFGTPSGRDSRTLRPAAFFHGMNVVEDRAVSVDCEKQKVHLRSGRPLPYDRLILATGGSALSLPIESPSGVTAALTLRRIEDLLKIEHEAKNVRNVLIMGAGLVGLHLAELFSAGGKKVLVLELRDQILPGLVDPGVARILTKRYEQAGIRILPGTSMAGIWKKQRALLSNGEPVRAELIVAAVGIRPNLEAVQGTAVEQKEGILVNGRMETSVPGIYACGDVAEYRDLFTGETRLNPNVISAAEQGKTAAESIMGTGADHPGLVSINTFRCLSTPLLSVGKVMPDRGDRLMEELDEKSGSMKRLVFRDGILKGALFMNAPADGGLYYRFIREQVKLRGFEKRILADPLCWGKRIAEKVFPGTGI